jgi:hypothetical protein
MDYIGLEELSFPHENPGHTFPSLILNSFLSGEYLKQNFGIDSGIWLKSYMGPGYNGYCSWSCGDCSSRSLFFSRGFLQPVSDLQSIHGFTETEEVS